MFEELRQQLPAEIMRENELMKYHTSFNIGGPADLMVLPHNVEEVKYVVTYCHNNAIPLLVIGRGSNLLVRDKGIRGVVMKLGSNFQEFLLQGDQIQAQAGISLYDLARNAAAASLQGLEFAEGIPGSLGGAVVMNAGAYGGEMSDVVVEVQAMDETGEIRMFKADELNYSYRRSVFQEMPCYVLTARMQLVPGDNNEINARMQEYAQKRADKQPLEMPSAGSTFKRPEGYFVGPMIEELGMKGYPYGRAQISAKHAGFIVNRGGARAEDVLALIAIVQKRVREKYGIDLQPEVRVVGEE
ncbi:MAG TPA: UDP-N-acetylmuramate dehydrogenase [Syntrophomonas sp.]|nr:UDP-N-acetylmuramate dehydrogenase [Syntrophomonas sp.]